MNNTKNYAKINKNKFMKNFLFFVLFLFAFYTACQSVNYDYDLFARLIVGERIIESHILPFHDFLSYTPSHNWYDHEWGSGAVFYLILKYFGSFGILFFHALMMFLTTVFVLKIQNINKAKVPFTFLFGSVFLAFYYSLNISPVRCQLFSFLFFAVYLFLLEKNRQSENYNKVWIILPLTVLWNNLHGGVISGIGLIFLYFLGALIERKPAKKYFLLFALSFCSLIINPYGYTYFGFLIPAVTMTRKYIAEWWNVFSPYHFYKYIPVLLFMLIMLFTSIINAYKRKKADFTKFLVISLTLAEGLLHVKLLSLGLITISAFCFRDFLLFFNRFRFVLMKIEKSLILAVIVLALSIPFYSPTFARANFDRFPLKEVEFLKQNNIKGNLLVPFGVGSYVSYKLYPNNLIYIDGRYEEVYNNREFLALKDYELGESNWRDVINNYGTEILMPLRDIDIYNILLQDLEWKQIYEGRKFGVFVKKDRVKASYKMPSDDINYYRKTLFESYFNHGRITK